MAYTSNSEFDLETNVQITNETPLHDIYAQMHGVLKNDMWKWLIGYQEVDHEIPYEGLSISDSETLYPHKIVNGKIAPNYGEKPHDVWEATEDGGSYVTVKPNGTRMKLDGCMMPENDLFLHEIYRYLNCIYPDHPDWLELLTRNEILDAFNDAAAKVDYKPNNEFFKLVADSLNDEPELEEFKLNLRNLTNNAIRRKFYGSFLGYRMVAGDVLQSMSIFPTGTVFPLLPVNKDSIENKDKVIDTFDERYQLSFRRVDWLGNKRSNPFLKENGFSFPYYILPGFPYTIFEFISSQDGKSTASDYRLFNDDSNPFFEINGIKGSLIDLVKFNVLEYKGSFNDEATFVTSDDKVFGIESSKKHKVIYKTLYTYYDWKCYTSDVIEGTDESHPFGEIQPHPEYFEPVYKYYLENYSAYDAQGLLHTERSGYFKSLLQSLQIRLTTAVKLYSELKYFYNPFIKDTISLDVATMINMYPSLLEYNSEGFVMSIKENFPKDFPLQKGMMISFEPFQSLDFELHQVLGFSFGKLRGSIIAEKTSTEYHQILNYGIFNVNNDNISSPDNYGVLIETDNKDLVVLYGSLRFKWSVQIKENAQFIAPSEMQFTIKCIPDEKSIYEIGTLTSFGVEAKRLKEAKEKLESLNIQLTHIEGLIAGCVPGAPELDGYLEDKTNIENQIATVTLEIQNLENSMTDAKKNKEYLIKDGELTMNVGCKIKKFFFVGKTGCYPLDFILDEATLTYVSLGNISVTNIDLKDADIIKDPKKGIELTNPKDDTEKIKLFFPKSNIKLARSKEGQLVSKMSYYGRNFSYTPDNTVRVYNNETFNITIESVVNNSTGDDAAYKIFFVSDEAKKRFESITIGSLITGVGVEKDTYVVSAENFVIKTNKKLSQSGTFFFTYTCLITTSPDSVKEDFFNYKKLMFENNIYDKVSFFDKGVYGTKEWPNISQAIMEGDLKSFSILNKLSFSKTVKYLYGHKISKQNKYLLPSMYKFSKNVFADINIKDLLHLKNKFGSTENLMNVEWLDYLENLSNELSLAKENLNIGTNLLLNTDTSGFASLTKEPFTDKHLKTLFQTINWKDDTVPAYVQVGYGGAGMKKFWKITSSILYPNVYGGTMWDTQRNTKDEENKNWLKEMRENGGDLKKRSTWASIDYSFYSEKDQYKNYDNIDRPLFEIPLSEYNMNLLYEAKGNRKFSILDIVFYEHAFKNLTKEIDVKIASKSKLYHSLFDKVISGPNTTYSPTTDKNNIVGIAKLLKDFTYYEFNEKGELYLYINIGPDKNLNNNSFKEYQYQLINAGCLGPAPILNMGSFISPAFVSLEYGMTTYSSTEYTTSPAGGLYSNENIPKLSQDVLLAGFRYYVLSNLLSKTIDKPWSQLTKDDNNVTIINGKIKDLLKQAKYNIDGEEKYLFKNRVYFFTYFCGHWGEYEENDYDRLGLRDFDVIAAYVRDNDLVVSKVNKNYVFCTNILQDLPKKQKLTVEEINAFYGFYKGFQTIIPLHAKVIIDRLNGIDVIDSEYNNAITKNEAALKNSIRHYTKDVINEIQLPRKYIADGSYDISLFLNPGFKSSNANVISKAAIKRDDNDNFYTLENGSKVPINFEEQKYFKNIKTLEAAYKVEKAQDGTNKIINIPILTKIDGLPFNIGDLSTSDKFKEAKEVFLRSKYTPEYNTLAFDNHYKVNGEIYGFDEYGNIFISSIRKGPLSRFSDSNFISEVTNILPGKLNAKNEVDLIDKCKYWEATDDFAPRVVDVKIKKPLINEGYENLQFDSTFKYFKNLLVFEGYVDSLKANVLESDDSEYFFKATQLLSVGDTVTSGYAFNGTMSYHTISTDLQKSIKEVATSEDQIAFLGSDNAFYINKNKISDFGAIHKLETICITPSLSNDKLSDLYYDEDEQKWIIQEVAGNMSQLYHINDKGELESAYNQSAFLKTLFLESTTLPLDEAEGAYITDNVITFNDNLIKIPDVPAGAFPHNIANVKANEIAISSYINREIKKEDADFYNNEFVFEKNDKKFVKEIKESPFVLGETASSKYTRKYFKDDKITALISEDNIFVTWFANTYEKLNDGSFNITGSTTVKHWLRGKLPHYQSYTLRKLQNKIPDKAYEVLNKEIEEFKSFYKNGVTIDLDNLSININGESISKDLWNSLQNTFDNFTLLTFEKFKNLYDENTQQYKVGLPLKYIKKPFFSELTVNTSSSYNMNATIQDGKVWYDYDYYQYLNFVSEKIFGFRIETDFFSAGIEQVFTHKDSLFIRTSEGTLFSLPLDKLNNIAYSPTWETSLHPAMLYFADSTKNRFDTVNVSELVTVGADIYTIHTLPVHHKTEIRTVFDIKTSLSTPNILFSAGYTHGLNDVKARISQVSGPSLPSEQETEMKKYCQNINKTPYIQWSNDGGITFNALPLTTKYSGADKDKDLMITSMKFENNILYAYVASADATAQLNGKYFEIPINNLAIDYDNIKYKDDINKNVWANSITFPVSKGTLTYWPQKLGGGVDNIKDFFVLDYKGSLPVNLKDDLKVVSIENNHIVFNKEIVTEASNNKIRVLLSLRTSQDVTNPERYIDRSKLIEYTNGKGNFKVDIIEEVESNAFANKAYFAKYLNNFSIGGNENSSSFLGYPTVEDDKEKIFYKYDEDGNPISYKNAFGNEIKLCNENGLEYLHKYEKLTFEKSLYQIIQEDSSVDLAMTASTPLASPKSVENNIEYMLAGDDIAGLKKDNRAIHACTATDNIETEGPLLRIAGVNFNEASKLLVDASDTTNEKYTNFIKTFKNFIVSKESGFNTAENSYSDFDDRFEVKDGPNNKKYLYDKKYKVFVLANKRFTSIIIDVPYLCYNDGTGPKLLANPPLEVENDLLIKIASDSSMIYYHPRGYGGLRNNNSIIESTPWDRDKNAFTEKLLKNKYNDYVYLSDSKGNLIEPYNAVQTFDGKQFEAHHDDFLNNGENVVTLCSDNKCDEVLFYKVPKTNNYIYYSNNKIVKDSVLYIKCYKNMQEMNIIEYPIIKDNYNIILTRKDGKYAKGFLDSNGKLTIISISDSLEDTEVVTKVIKASYNNKKEYEFPVIEFGTYGEANSLIESIKNITPIYYTKNTLYTYSSSIKNYEITLKKDLEISNFNTSEEYKVEKKNKNTFIISVLPKENYNDIIVVLKKDTDEDAFIIPNINITDDIYKGLDESDTPYYFMGESNDKLKNENTAIADNSVFDTKENVIIVNKKINFLCEIASSVKIKVVESNNYYIIKGLKGRCISRVPKYTTFKSLLENEGITIEKEGAIIKDFKNVNIRSISDTLDQCLLSNKLPDVSDEKERYFKFKILTIAYQPLPSAVMNDPEHFMLLDKEEIVTFPPDRVYYNSFGLPHPPIRIGDNLFNTENNYLYEKEDFINDNASPIYLCDDNGKYITYYEKDNKLLYKILGDNNGDCSLDINVAIDKRFISKKPKYFTCKDWFKSTFHIDDNEVNPFWQIIKISPKLSDKKFLQELRLLKYKKEGTNQVLIDVKDDEKYVEISTIKSLDIESGEIVVKDEKALNLETGTIKFLAAEGNIKYNTTESLAINGLKIESGLQGEAYNSSANINSTIKCSYTVNTKRDFTKQVQDNNSIAYITELGIFDKNHRLIAYANFPPIEYRTEKQHVSFTCVVYHGNMVDNENSGGK